MNEHRWPVTDERITAAIEAAGVEPTFCEWYGDPEHRIIFRLETHMGHYAERVLSPYMDDEALAHWIGRLPGEVTTHP